jgi:hypothetical protein
MYVVAAAVVSYISSRLRAISNRQSCLIGTAIVHIHCIGFRLKISCVEVVSSIIPVAVSAAYLMVCV